MRRVKDHLTHLLTAVCGLMALGAALGVFCFVFWKGKNVISWTFLSQSPRGIPLGTEGGIFPAIVGTLYLGLLSGAIGGFLALLGALYLEFFCKRLWMRRLVQSAVSCLSGIPSILFGLVGYSVLVYGLGWPRSLLTAAITVSAMIYPFAFIRMQKILQDNCRPLMQAALSLGISQPYAIFHMALPHVLSELSSTALLAMTYGMGAAAPVIFTGAVLHAPIPSRLDQPFMSLSYHLYIMANDGISFEYAYGTAFVLLALVLVLNAICRIPGWVKKGR